MSESYDTAVESTADSAPSGRSLELRPGTQLGRYLILDQLGAGAMGVVFAAYDPQLDRKIAIKLLKVSDGPAQARLQREAQALAKLEHPNVIGVHDVGVHEQQLFIAMEFVEGQTLRAWMDASPGSRPWQEVVAVLSGAGRGLAAAHRVGLIHRDFKPDNVMIGADRRVRVMDFGLARYETGTASQEPPEFFSTGSDRFSISSRLTATGAIMGTPAYMSLEQLEGLAIDHRSDQYSFCVVLYEALYGERPFFARTLAELRDKLAAGVAAPRRSGSTPAWLRKVVVRGLAPNPADRFASMDALLEALAADPAIRRRRLGVGVGLCLALTAGVWGAMRGNTQAPNQACTGMDEKLAGVWDDDRRAEVTAAIEATGLRYGAETTARVHALLDDYTQRWVAARVEACEATLRGEQSGELLDRRMACLDQRLIAVRATVDVLAQADSDVVRRSVQAIAQLPELGRCADLDALQAEVPPPDDPALAQRVASLDQQLIEAWARRQAGQFEPALERSESILQAAESVGYPPLLARTHIVIGRVYEGLGRYDEGRAALERGYSIALGERMLTEAAEAASALLRAESRTAHYEDARAWAVHAEALSRATGDRVSRAEYMLVLADLDRAEGKREDAREHYKQALELLEAALGPEHPTVGTTLNNLGGLLHESGEYEEAIELFERALKLQMAALGPEHPAVALSLTNRGTLATRSGDYAKARTLHDQALTIFRAALGPDHEDVSLVLGNLGNLARAEGKRQEAAEYDKQALAVREKALGPDHPKVALALINVGTGAFEEGKLDEARGYLERALAIQESKLGKTHRDVGLSVLNLGHLATEQGDLDRAVAMFERGRVVFAGLNPKHPLLAHVDIGLGDVARKRGDLQQARTHYQGALALREEVQGPDHPEVGQVALLLGTALLDLGEPAQALVPLERSLAIDTAQPTSRSFRAEVEFTLARALWTAPATAGRDRARARQLAEQSRTDYMAEDSSDFADELAAIDAWLQTHAAG
jgi:tetratricopeptide (TPR) repeat protein/predicted Ser/Thr protein kinase